MKKNKKEKNVENKKSKRIYWIIGIIIEVIIILVIVYFKFINKQILRKYLVNYQFLPICKNRENKVRS